MIVLDNRGGDVVLDPHSLQRMIEQLGRIGTLEGGGLWRALGSDADIEARRLVTGWMTERNLEVRTDGAGSLYGKLAGDQPEAVVAGSHLDTVRGGGAYDGAVGIIAALAAVDDVVARRGRPRHTVEVVATAEEEGGRFDGGYIGSRGIAGLLTAADLFRTDAAGVTLASALQRAGAVEDYRNAARRDIRAYLELHIEQGPVLLSRNATVGVVELVTGIHQLVVKITGRTDHAGTTPMDARRDALLSAARFTADLPALASEIGHSCRATVGRLDVTPNAPNVIAGQVSFSVDLRDTDLDRLCALDTLARAWIEECGENMMVDIRAAGRQAPVSMDPDLCALALEVSQQLGITAITMDSGAGHDAQVLQSITPACLLFVPCKDGRSHCPDEYCSPEDIASGAGVLAGMVERLAW